MAVELSSNWKKLQATLKQHFQSPSAQKRKASAPPSQRQQDTAAKRRRLEDASTRSLRSVRSTSKSTTKTTSTKKMGSWISTSAATAQEKTAADSETSSRRFQPHSQSLPAWATENDISAADLAAAYGTTSSSSTSSGPLTLTLPKDRINAGFSTDVLIGKYVAIDCEMVGVGGSEDRSVLARVSLVNFHGVQIYDSYVRPVEYVTDWRTHVSGISPKCMVNARSFAEVQKDVAGILEGRILVGHAIRNDLEVLMISHPRRDVRDTARYKGYRKISGGRAPALRVLAREVLGVEVQRGEHSSLEDARVTMGLFRRCKDAFEVEHAARWAGKGEVVASGNASGGGKGKAKKRKKKGKR